MEQRTGRIAIVTGASHGIGAAVAERLARDGFTVVINYSGDAAPAEALVRKIEDKGGRALAAKADVSDAQAVRGMFDAAEAAFGGVDVLVNNAGIMPLSTIADTGDATFERLIDVNLKGTFNTLREAARRLRNGGRRSRQMQLERHPWNRSFTWAARRGPFRRVTAAQARAYDEHGFFVLENAFDADGDWIHNQVALSHDTAHFAARIELIAPEFVIAGGIRAELLKEIAADDASRKIAAACPTS